MQLELDYALAQAEDGMRRALDHAERDYPKQGAEYPTWGEAALAWLRAYAERHEEFPGWFVTSESSRDPKFPDPINPKAWGMIWRRAQRLGIVVHSGKTTPRPTRHGCPAVVWRSLVYRA